MRRVSHRDPRASTQERLAEALDAGHAVDARVDPRVIAAGAAVHSVTRPVPGAEEVVPRPAEQRVAARAALRGALALLREHRVVRPLVAEPPREELVRAPVALGAVAVRTQREQELTGLGRDARGQSMVVR